MYNNSFNFQIAKERIDLVDYLASLGYHSVRQSGNDYWFLSPLHDEKNASFKVNRIRQIWYDHGIGKGGDLVSFAKEYHQSDYKELLQKFREYLHLPDQLHDRIIISEKQKDTSFGTNEEGKRIDIVAENSIQSGFLKAYIHARKIPLPLTEQYCKEIEYTLKGHKFIALGFKNDAGGFELRNKNFKASSTSKAPTIIDLSNNNQTIQEEKLAVFEGFFSFLSFMTLMESGQLFVEKPDKILVLNSLAFLQKRKDVMMSFGHIDLYFDNDTAGNKATDEALGWGQNLTDRRYLYEGFNDLNTFICQQRQLREGQQKSHGMQL